MAKIKCLKYEFDGRIIEVNINCSSSGMFTANLNREIQDKLGLGGRITSSNLNELQDTIKDAFIAYKDAKTSYKLMIAISFGACGELTKRASGEENEKFFQQRHNPYKLNMPFSSVRSAIGLDYRVVVEENRDGRINYYRAMPKSEDVFKYLSDVQTIGDYYIGATVHIDSIEKIIEFNESAIKKLDSIIAQFRKASEFLIDLITNDNLEMILANVNLNLLSVK